MVLDFAPPLALLHEGGWDEVLMVAVALGIAYVVIVWSGRRNQEDDNDDLEDDEDAGALPPDVKQDPPSSR